MRSENKTRKEIREWWNSDDNPLIKASENEDKALAQYQVAAINVTKHLGYSKQRLKEMWEWRINNGKKERESWGKVINPDPWFEKSMNLGEIDFFCKNF